MREKFSGSMLAVIVASGAVISGPIDPTAAQTPAPPATASAPALTTPWGEPHLQGIWTDETDTPLQRSLKYASQEFFSEDDKLAQESSLLMDRLVRQGRAFGIHVLLGSQTIGGAYSLARSTIDQIRSE